VSVLRDRIVSQNYNGTGMGDMHPVGTGATPMVMPMMNITYRGEDALYATLHPLVTADGATVPGRAVYWPGDIAGKPAEGSNPAP